MGGKDGNSEKLIEGGGGKDRKNLTWFHSPAGSSGRERMESEVSDWKSYLWDSWFWKLVLRVFKFCIWFLFVPAPFITLFRFVQLLPSDSIRSIEIFAKSKVLLSLGAQRLNFLLPHLGFSLPDLLKVPCGVFSLCHCKEPIGITS